MVLANSTSVYKIIAKVELDTSKIQSRLDNISKNTHVNLDTGDASRGVDALSQSGENLGLTFQQANMIMSKSIDVISDMVEQVFTLDNAITEFRKISNLDGKELDDYVDKLAQLGEQVGRTGSEMVEAATNFEKAGFDDETSARLATISIMLQNVADESVGAGEATDFLVSQMTAFNIESDNAIHIADAVNEVAANFAVTTGNLMTNLPKVSASLAVGNNTMEQTIGLKNRSSKNCLIDWNTLRAYSTKQIKVMRFVA